MANKISVDIARNFLKGRGVDTSNLDATQLADQLGQYNSGEKFEITDYQAPTVSALPAQSALPNQYASPLSAAPAGVTSGAVTSNPLESYTGAPLVSALPATTPAVNTTRPVAKSVDTVDYSPIGSESYTGLPPATSNNTELLNPSPGYNPLAGALVDQLGGPNPASNSIAQNFLNQGVSDLNDIGVRTVNETRFYPAIDDVSPERNEEVPVTQFYNKKTDQIIDPNRIGIIQNGTNGVQGGDVFYNLATDANGNLTFQEQFSPRSRGFMATPVGQLINFGAKFTPAAPLSYAYDAYRAADRGDPLGFALAVAGGAGSLAESPLTPDKVGSDWATSGASTPIDVLGGKAITAVNAVKPALQVAQAIKNEDWSGLATLGANAVGAGSTKIGNTGFTLGDAGRFASIGGEPSEQ